MTPQPSPLGLPPRKAHFRPSVRNGRRAYGTALALVIGVFGGWAILDAARWNDLRSDQQYLTVGFAVLALLALVVLSFVDHPLRRDLRLARTGEVARGEVLSLEQSRRRRRRVMIAYTFRTRAGETIAGQCILPRRFSGPALEPGLAIEVLYDRKHPHWNKPRLALGHIEFRPAASAEL